VEDDVVTAFIDFDAGEMSFSLNGLHLGVAFTDFDKNQEWFPAVSLSSDQQCTFIFGNSLEGLSVPAGYEPILPRFDAFPITKFDKKPERSEFSSKRIYLSDIKKERESNQKGPDFGEGLCYRLKVVFSETDTYIFLSDFIYLACPSLVLWIHLRSI
jgi:hypothetical protein